MFGGNATSQDKQKFIKYIVKSSAVIEDPRRRLCLLVGNIYIALPSFTAGLISVDNQILEYAWVALACNVQAKKCNLLKWLLKIKKYA